MHNPACEDKGELGDEHTCTLIKPVALFPVPPRQGSVHSLPGTWVQALKSFALTTHLPPSPAQSPKFPVPCKRLEDPLLAAHSLRAGACQAQGSLRQPRLRLLTALASARTYRKQLLCAGGQLQTWGRGGTGWALLPRASHASIGAVEAADGPQALVPRGRLCGECSSTDCRRRTSRSSQSVSGSRPFSTARRSDRLLAGGNST